ncbi:MAG: hypothetical protein R2817_06645 [Flavobacteriales bacterium]
MQGSNDLIAADIAWHMYQYASSLGHAWITPNVLVYDWESDLLTVSPDGFACEIEIKVSRSDLMNDLQKPKHREGILMNGAKASIARSASRRIDGDPSTRPIRPNFFCFALPCSVYRGMQRGTLPPYAGIYTVDGAGRVFEEKRPILLHDRRMTQNELLGLARRMHVRYWAQVGRERRTASAETGNVKDPSGDRGIDRA